jgi:hypothetical protein
MTGYLILNLSSIQSPVLFVLRDHEAYTCKYEIKGCNFSLILILLHVYCLYNEYDDVIEVQASKCEVGGR